MNPVRVTILMEGKSYARIRAAALDTHTYRAFQEATEGTKFVRNIGKVAPLDKVPEMMMRLRHAVKNGFSLFDVVLEDDTREALTKRTAVQWLDIQAVRDRIERIDDEIYKRTLAKTGKGNRLFPYQRTGAQWLAVRDAGLLADDMGLGKTIQTIAAIPSGSPIVVVCPVKVKGDWLGETARWRPQIHVKVLRGKTSFVWPKPSEMVVLNYDILPDIHDRKKCDGYLAPEPCRGCKTRTIVQLTNVVTRKDDHEPTCTGFSTKRKPCPGCAPFLSEAPHGTVVVFDEAHKIKNDKTGRSRQAHAIASAARAREGRTWLLTGTPLENTPRELWNVLDLAGLAEATFDNFPTFLRLFHASKKNKFGGFVFGLPEEEVKDRMRRHSLRRMKAEVLPDLPTKMWKDHIVDIDRKTIASCEKFLESHGGVDRLVDLLKADKVPFELMSAVREALATAKIQPMLDYIEYFEEENEPVVVFSAHRRPIEALADRPGWGIIMGGVSEKKSRQAIEDFQAGKLKGLGVTIRAGGQGITLTRASQAVFVDLDWKPTANQQAEDRLLRIGQTRGVVITIIHANHPLDRRVTEVLFAKTQMIQATVDASSITVAEGSVADAEMDAYVARIKLEVEEGNTERTVPDEARKPLIHALSSLSFEPAHERMALELVEEAEAIGLSAVQWKLAEHIAKKGREPEVPETPKATPKETKKQIRPANSIHKEKENTTMRQSDRDRERRGEAKPKATDKAPVRVPNQGSARPSSRRDRPASREDRRAERLFERSKQEADHMSEQLYDMRDAIEDLEPEHRIQVASDAIQFLNTFEDDFCLDCGEEQHDKEEDCEFYSPEGSSSRPPPSNEGEDEEDEESDETAEPSDESETNQ